MPVKSPQAHTPPAHVKETLFQLDQCHPGEQGWDISGACRFYSSTWLTALTCPTMFSRMFGQQYGLCKVAD